MCAPLPVACGQLEESQPRTAAREAFDAARDAYRAALDAAGEGGLSRDDALRGRLRALIAAADAAVAVGCTFGAELELARSGLSAAERAADLERLAVEARAQAERARDAAAEEAARAAIAAQEHAAAAAAEAEALRQRFLAAVPAEPPASAPRDAVVTLRVRLPTGATLTRRFESTSTIAQLRAWVGSEYPSDALPPLAPDFVLRTQPLPGSGEASLVLRMPTQTVAEAGLRGLTLIVEHAPEAAGTSGGAAGSSSGAPVDVA